MRLAKDGADAQTQLEVALVKAAAPEVDPSTRALLARLERMESALRGAPAAAPAPAAAAPPAPVAPPASVAADPPAAVAPPVAPSAPLAAPPQNAPSPPPPAAPPVAAAPEPEVEPAAAVAVAEPVAPMGELDLAMVTELWPAVLQNLSENKQQLLAGCLAEARPIIVSGRDITLAFTPDCGFQKRKAEDPAARQLLTSAFRELTGVSPRLIMETREAEELGAEPEVLGEDDFIARLRAEFDAVDHQPDQEEQEQA
jgi:DNA polymerase-3 subunit gamma/tau